MMINFEQVRLTADRSFAAYDYQVPVVVHPFHVHEELELVLVSNQGGVLYCGADNVPFFPDDLFLFAGRLPHRFEGRPNSGAGHVEPSATAPSVTARVIQFRKDAFGSGFLALPENRPLRDLLDKATDGLVLRRSSTDLDTAEELAAIIGATGPRRLIGLLSILEKLSGFLEEVSSGVSTDPPRQANCTTPSLEL